MYHMEDQKDRNRDVHSEGEPSGMQSSQTTNWKEAHVQPTSPEELRYYEMLYYHLLDRYFTSSDPTKLYSFIELMSITFGLNNTIMTQATSAIMRNDFEFMPRPRECAVLMAKFSPLTKRQQAKRLNISPTQYYNLINTYEDSPFPITPKLSADQTVEVAKAMKEYIHIARSM